MEQVSEVIDSNENYNFVKLLVGQLSQSQQERLKREITIAESTETDNEQTKLANPLTGREQQVLVLITDGYTRKEVGELLNISHNTVSCHVAHVYDKLHVSTIAEATRAAMRLGVLDNASGSSTRASRRAGMGLQSVSA